MRKPILGMAAFLIVVLGVGSSWAEQIGKPTWRFETANDVAVDSDNQFTNGFTFQKHSAAFTNLDEVKGTPAFGKGLARLLLPERDGLYYREGFTFGQNMFRRLIRRPSSKR